MNENYLTYLRENLGEGFDFREPASEDEQWVAACKKHPDCELREWTLYVLSIKADEHYWAVS